MAIVVAAARDWALPEPYVRSLRRWSPCAGRTRSDREATREGAAGAWRNAFLQAPYVRDVLVRGAFVCETFETAITWDRFEQFHAEVMDATRDALKRVCGTGSVACRFTHVYPDGPAPAGGRGSARDAEPGRAAGPAGAATPPVGPVDASCRVWAMSSPCVP